MQCLMKKIISINFFSVVHRSTGQRVAFLVFTMLTMFQDCMCPFVALCGEPMRKRHCNTTACADFKSTVLRWQHCFEPQ